MCAECDYMMYIEYMKYTVYGIYDKQNKAIHARVFVIYIKAIMVSIDWLLFCMKLSIHIRSSDTLSDTQSDTTVSMQWDDNAIPANAQRIAAASLTTVILCWGRAYIVSDGNKEPVL